MHNVVHHVQHDALVCWARCLGETVMDPACDNAPSVHLARWGHVALEHFDATKKVSMVCVMHASFFWHTHTRPTPRARTQHMWVTRARVLRWFASAFVFFFFF
jgi:hypothetical protein